MNEMYEEVKRVINEASLFDPDKPINTVLSDNIQDVSRNQEYSEFNVRTKGSDKNVLFVSFDICGSTELKTKFQNKWLDMIRILLSNKLPNMSFWKFNGDEILYFTEVHSLSFVIELVKDVSFQVEFLQNQFKDAFQQSIFVKATAWIARVNFGNEKELKDQFESINNFEFLKNGLCDYVGINIDEGFRLCSHASPRKVLLDPKIVFLLMKSQIEGYYDQVEEIPTYQSNVKDLLDHIYFCGFVKCKGIWQNRKYPIYWYIPKDLEKIVHYDEVDDLNTLKRIGEEVDKSFAFLERIFINVEILDNDIELLDNSFKIYESEDTQKRTETVANLYYMVTCINPLTGNILLAKRSLDRVHLKGVWDFGNVKYQKVDMPEFIAKEYENTFGIKISLDLDTERDYNIVPHGCCRIYRNCNPHNGILCHAIITSPIGSDEELKSLIEQHIKKNKKLK